MAANVIVFGNGSSGQTAARLLNREGASVTILDGADQFPTADNFDFAVTSPGIPLNHPWQVAARERNIKVISELQLAAQHWHGKIIAITGSKGKSSVVKLVAQALDAVPCGNYGTPFSEVVLTTPESEQRWAVVEVSSFQMETTDDFHADIAACLNLQEDHLDRHGSIEEYHALKRKLLAMAKQVVTAQERFDEYLRGSYFDNEVLRPNGEIAAGIMEAAQIKGEMITRAFNAFIPLAHRMCTVPTCDGRTWIDDSKATSVAALIAGVKMASALKNKGLRLIAGGLSKNDNAESASIFLHKYVKKVYIIGSCAEVFMRAWSKVVACEECGTLETACKNARRDSAPGECILLSPGTASFDQFKSYAERGDAFAQFAKEQKNEDNN